MKKTPSADKSADKAVATKKETGTEKKLKADVPAEKEGKKASAKAAKLDSENGKESKPVVIPKTSTDKKVDYEPDFLKSVLDTPAMVPNTPTMRYNDAELQEFRDLIGKKLNWLKRNLHICRD